MPIKPWTMEPKRSLNIFGGLDELLNERQARADAAEQKQQSIEDRVFGSIRQGQEDVRRQEMHDLNTQTLEERLKEMRKPPLAKPNRTYDQKRGKVIDLDTQSATDLGFGPEPTEPRNIDPLSAQGIKARIALEKATQQATTPKEPSTTDGERKGAAFMQRVIPAGQRLNKFDTRQALDVIASKAGMWGNWAKSPEGRQLEQAGRTWAISVLRPESGATITPEEMESYQATYLPVPGDDDATLAQKRQARREAEESIAAIAGRAMPKGAFTSAIQADSAATANKPPAAPRTGGVMPTLTPVPATPARRNPWKP